MTQDSLARALGGLKGARMDDVAADDIRKRLDSAWAERAHRRPRSRFALPGFARAFAVAALVVIVAFSTMRAAADSPRSEEHTSELQSRLHLVCRLLLENKKHI